MRIDTLKPAHIAQYLETRKREGNPARGNRERAVLSSIHEFGMRQGWVEANPCRGVKRNTERPRKRYVTDEEFLDAFNRSPEPFQDLLALAYLTGARQGDIRSWGFSVALAGCDAQYEILAYTQNLRILAIRSMQTYPPPPGLGAGDGE